MLYASDKILQVMDDHAVLRPSEIRRLVNRRWPDGPQLEEENLRACLKRLVDRRKLHHIGHSQYSKDPAAKTLASQRSDKLAALERRIETLEKVVAYLQKWAP